MANYGCGLAGYDETFSENQIHFYTENVLNASMGRVTTIIDGMGNRADITYDYATRYTRTSDSSNSYPVNTYALPLPVVRELWQSNGVADDQKILYSYKDFKVHMTGAGPLGFSEVSQTNKTTGESIRTIITKWDEERWIPTEIKVINTVGDWTSTTISTTTVADVNGTYFAYESNNHVTDIDGNIAETISNYDVDKGVILDQTVKNMGDNMYKKVVYSGYQNISGKWLPSSMKMIQKHVHDPAPYTTETRYTYDEKGNILTTTINAGTPLALTTIATYDAFGNILSSRSSGQDVKTVTKYNDYDSSGRFVIKSYYYPSAAVNEFRYDCWGNIWEKADITDPSNVLVTGYLYDTWQRLIETVAPDRSRSTSIIGWGEANAKDKKYYILTEKSESPWVLTWYDAVGHEVSQESFGPKNVLRNCNCLCRTIF